MFIHFKIVDDVDLFTVCDYKKLLKLITEHFISECLKYYCEIISVRPYYNPTIKEGCIEFECRGCFDMIPDLEFPDGNNILTITFF